MPRARTEATRRAKPCSSCGLRFNPADLRAPSHGPGLRLGLRWCETCYARLAHTFIDRQQGRDRDAYYRRRYGLSAAQTGDLFLAQQGRCAICKGEPGRRSDGTAIPLCVDHDHETGDVRGLLCANCNSGIGLLKEDISVLASAVIYLTAYREAR